MGGGYRRKKTHKVSKAISGTYRLRNRTKDLDQVAEELARVASEGKASVLPEYDEDLPGGGQFLCVECSRHFSDGTVLNDHIQSKSHKKRYVILILNVAHSPSHDSFISIRHYQIHAPPYLSSFIFYSFLYPNQIISNNLDRIGFIC